MGVEGIDLKPIIKFKMNYGPNDNEISLLYKGRVDPADVKYDPGEIESIHYYRLEEVDGMINHDRSRFCGWFVEILNWYHGKPAKLRVLAVY
jgi:isopentenyldiphosphate isomerase